MHIAYVLSPEAGRADRLLCDIAGRLMGEGLLLCGVVQRETPTGTGYRCHMDLRLLPDGPDLRISQDRGALARGCRLDAEALETAVLQTIRRLTPDTDLLIVNKFGKHESMGRGFRQAIAQAVELDVPVLLGVNPMNLEAFEHFTGSGAVRLESTVTAVQSWLRCPALAQGTASHRTMQLG